MRDLLRRLFPLDIYPDPIQRRQALGTYVSGFFILLGLAAIFVTNVVRLIFRLPGEALGDPTFVLQGVVLFGISVATIELTRRGRQSIGAAIIVGGWMAMCYAVVLLTGLEVGFGFAILLIGISLGALLIGERTVPWTVAASIVLLWINLVVNPNAPGNNPRLVMFSHTALIIMHGVVNYALAQGMRAVARQVAESSERRFSISQVSSTIAQRLLTTRLDLDVLVNETVTLVRDAFADVSDVQLFLVDSDRKNATLVASTHTSASGTQQVGVGSLGIIGRVTISGQSIVVRDTEESQGHRRAALLPGAHAELAIPLRVGDETIGALDLQSPKADAFGTEDVKLIGALANQIAIAIDNARLYTEAQARLAENQRLYEQARANLKEIERLNQQLIGGAWAEYLRSAPAIPAYTVDLVSGQTEEAAEWTPTLAEASLRNQVIVRQTGQTKMVALPISVHGQVIGAMEFEILPEQDVSQAQMVILQQVIERLGLAAENARLLEEAQRIAQREALVNEISARLQATTNVEAVVAAATQSLADAFQSPRVAIRLGTPVEA